MPSFEVPKAGLDEHTNGYSSPIHPQTTRFPLPSTRSTTHL